MPGDDSHNTSAKQIALHVLQGLLGVCVCASERVACHVLIPASVLLQKVQLEFSPCSLFIHLCVSDDGTGEPLFKKVHKCFSAVVLSFFFFFF